MPILVNIIIARSTNHSLRTRTGFIDRRTRTESLRIHPLSQAGRTRGDERNHSPQCTRHRKDETGGRVQ